MIRKAFGIVLNVGLLVLTVIILFACIEVYFRFFFVESDSWQNTLVSRHWFKRYWNPVNSYGFRDIEHSLESLRQKKIMMVVGDSFAAGYGIKDCRDRFTDILRSKMPPSWAVMSVAKNGWQTEDQYRGIVNYPLKPDIIILSYFPNDIQGAANSLGFYRKGFFEPPLLWLRSLIGHSYAFNYFYWHIYRFMRRGELQKIYWEYSQDCFFDPKIWARHQDILGKILDYAKSFNIRLIVLVFPNLLDVARSKPFTDKIVNFLKAEQVEYIDLSEHLYSYKPAQLTVNRSDAHPNKQLHKKVAELIFEALGNNP